MKRHNKWAILVLLWLATALRFYRLDAQSFWNDEGNSARLAERSLALIVEGAAGDIHPPLYYLVLHGWRALLGDGEFALRALSAFAGVLLVAVVFALARTVSLARNRTEFAHLAALFAALHPALVYYSQETRMYALLGLWAVLSTLLLLHLLPHFSRPPSRRLTLWAAGYILAATAGLYTHYFFPAVLLTHNLIIVLTLLQFCRKRHTSPAHRQAATPLQALVTWCTLMLATFLLYLPWLPIFLRQAVGRAADSVSAWTFLSNAARWLAVGETGAADGGWWVVGALVVVGFGRWTVDDRRWAGAGGWGASRSASILSLLIPLLLMVLAGLMRPAYYKFLIIAAPFVCLLAARGVVGVWNFARPQRLSGLPAPLLFRAALVVMVTIALWGSVRALRNMYFDAAFARADYRGIAARIASEAHPDAGIVLNAANQWEVFTYYHRDGGPVYPIPRGQPDPPRVEAELEEIAANHDRIYALFWGEAERDPQRLVERWLDANAFKAHEEWVGDVRFVTYAVPARATSDMEVQADAAFGAYITLLGYTIGSQELAAGDIVPVTLFWQTAEPLVVRYKVFLHLLGEEGQPLAQRDAEPGGNLSLTSTWQPGQTVVDNHGVLLPADLPPGRYALRVGLYPLDDPTARLPARWGASDRLPAGSGDSYPLANVTVR